MGYRKRYRRFSKKRTFRSKRRFGLSRRIKKTVMNMSQTKFKITTVSTTISTGGNYEAVWGNNISVGTGGEQRVGSQISVVKISFDIQCIYNRGVAGANNGFIRCMVLWPRKGLSTGDISTYATATNPGIFARADPDQTLTLYDKRVLLTNTNSTTPGAGQITARFRFSKYCKMMKCNYEDLTGTLDNMPIIYIASDANPLTDSHTVIGTYSISYKNI